MAFRGLRRQGYCPYTVTTDAVGNELESYGTGKMLPKVMKFSGTPTSDTVTLYGDDSIAEEETSQGNGSLTVDLTELALADQAAMLGHKYSEEEGMVCGQDDAATYCICSSIVPGVLNKKPFFRVVTYLRVRFAPVNDDYETKGQQVSYKTPSLSGSFYPNKDGNWKNVREFADFDAALAHFRTMLKMEETT